METAKNILMLKALTLQSCDQCIFYDEDFSKPISPLSGSILEEGAITFSWAPEQIDDSTKGNLDVDLLVETIDGDIVHEGSVLFEYQHELVLSAGHYRWWIISSITDSLCVKEVRSEKIRFSVLSEIEPVDTGE